MPTHSIQTRLARLPRRKLAGLAAVIGLGFALAARAADPEAVSLPWRPDPHKEWSAAGEERGCPLCQVAGIRLVRLSAADADSQGQDLSGSNLRALARVDSLYRAGNFGRPGSGEATRGAHLLARLSTRNAYEALLRLALDSTTVYEASESTLAGAFSHFSDPSLFPVTRLVRARFGLGRVCLSYDLSGRLDTLVSLGEKRVRVRLQETEIDHVRMRVLCMQLPTGLDDMVDVLLAPHFGCAVQRIATEGPPAPAQIDLMDDMDGFWVRKWGIHRPQALVFWVTPGADTVTVLPTVPLVGVRLYVPNLVLSLPFLPDVGFEDLRELDLPQPILDLDSIRRGSHPEWLRAHSDIGFEGWSCHGPVPAAVRQRFPDR